MDRDSQHAITLLSGLVAVAARYEEFARTVRSTQSVERVEPAFAIFSQGEPGGNPTGEIYAELVADAENDRRAVWTLCVEWDQASWSISFTISEVLAYGSHLIAETEARTVTTLDACIDTVAEFTAAMLSRPEALAYLAQSDLASCRLVDVGHTGRPVVPAEGGTLDTPSRDAIRLVAALAEIGKRYATFADMSLRGRAGISKIDSEMTIAEVPSDVTHRNGLLQYNFLAIRPTGEEVVWHFQLQWNERQWTGYTHIYANQAGTHTSLVRAVTQTAANLNDCIAMIRERVAAMLECQEPIVHLQLNTRPS